jgi:2-amino-4-hydroxy-6-hydroxymethyldihydropteridine diphosphokinase
MGRMNRAVIGVGSNIDPEENTAIAKREVGKIGKILQESIFIYTKPVLYTDQPDFLNGALLILTPLDMDALKKELRKIEADLGRERSANKNVPRAMDLDILVYNDITIDGDIYEREYLRDSIIELLPHFFEENPHSNA